MSYSQQGITAAAAAAASLVAKFHRQSVSSSPTHEPVPLHIIINPPDIHRDIDSAE